MTIGRAAGPARGRPPNAGVYAASFVARAHELMVLGFQKLEAASLATKAEDAITGLLVSAMRAVVDEATGALSWACRFSVHDDPPVTNLDPAVEGRKRNRIDIEIEHTVKGRHPRFRVEAKRLYDGNGSSTYVGEDGLGALVSGHYGDEFQQMGMLAYVQTHTREHWIAKVALAMEERRAEHRIPDGPAWKEHRLGSWRGFVSAHPRGRVPLDVYHSFFVCCVEHQRSTSGRSNGRKRREAEGG